MIVIKHIQSCHTARIKKKTTSPTECHLCERKGSEVTQSCPTLCDTMDCSLPGSSVHGIFQTRILELNLDVIPNLTIVSPSPRSVILTNQSGTYWPTPVR